MATGVELSVKIGSGNGTGRSGKVNIVAGRFELLPGLGNRFV
jgi:hypothetical protein